MALVPRVSGATPIFSWQRINNLIAVRIEVSTDSNFTYFEDGLNNPDHPSVIWDSHVFYLPCTKYQNICKDSKCNGLSAQCTWNTNIYEAEIQLKYGTYNYLTFAHEVFNNFNWGEEITAKDLKRDGTIYYWRFKLYTYQFVNGQLHTLEGNYVNTLDDAITKLQFKLNQFTQINNIKIIKEVDYTDRNAIIALAGQDYYTVSDLIVFKFDLYGPDAIEYDERQELTDFRFKLDEKWYRTVHVELLGYDRLNKLNNGTYYAMWHVSRDIKDIQQKSIELEFRAHDGLEYGEFVTVGPVEITFYSPIISNEYIKDATTEEYITKNTTILRVGTFLKGDIDRIIFGYAVNPSDPDNIVYTEYILDDIQGYDILDYHFLEDEELYHDFALTSKEKNGIETAAIYYKIQAYDFSGNVTTITQLSSIETKDFKGYKIKKVTTGILSDNITNLYNKSTLDLYTDIQF